MRLSAARLAMLGRRLAIAGLFWSLSLPVAAHEFRSAYLEIEHHGDQQYALSWRTPEAGRNEHTVDLAASPECDLSRQRDLPVERMRYQDYLLDCRRLGGLPQISLTGLDAAPYDVLVKVIDADGQSFFQQLQGKNQMVMLSKNEDTQIAAGLFAEGMMHVFGGPDHLLYIVLLFIFLRRSWKQALVGVTLFTIAHSLSLGLAMFDVIRIPPRPVEAVIALTICYFAITILRGQRAANVDGRRWQVVVAACGLIHGLGFANSLSSLGILGGDLLIGLATFNLGIEVAQIAVLILATMVYRLVIWLPRRFVMLQLERSAAIFIGATGSFWYLERLLG